MFSSRHPDTLKGLVDELGPSARAGTIAEAVEFGDVVMVVVPYTAIEQIGKDYGDALAKKVLVIAACPSGEAAPAPDYISVSFVAPGDRPARLVLSLITPLFTAQRLSLVLDGGGVA